MPRVRARLKRAELGRRRVQGLVALSAVAALLTAAPVAAQRARRVEGIAAFVGGTAPGNDTVAILRSDVTLHARLALAQETARLPTGPLPAPLLAAALDEIIGEVLIAREADRLRAARPTDARIEEERARIEARVKRKRASAARSGSRRSCAASARPRRRWRRSRGVARTSTRSSARTSRAAP